MYFFFPEMQEHLSQQSEKVDFVKTLKNIFGDPNQVNALLAGFILVIAHFMIIPYISPYLIKNVGLTQFEISYQFFFGGIATIITSPYIGRLTDKYGVMRVFTIVMFLSFIPTVLITNLAPISIGIAITYTTIFFITGTGRMISPNTIITAAAGVANRGSFMSVKSALQQLAIGLSSIVGGRIVVIGADGYFHHYEYVGYLSIAFGIIAIFMVRRIKVAEGN